MKCFRGNKYIFVILVSIFLLPSTPYGMTDPILKGNLNSDAHTSIVGGERGYFLTVASPQSASSISSLLKKAESGDPVSQYRIGYMYFYGDKVVQDYSDAAYWFARSAASGNSDAQFMVGYMYAKGEGVKKDNKKATYWYEEAARKGHAGAMFRLGEMYLRGDGIARDMQKGNRLLSESAKKGNKGAVRLLNKFKQKANH